MKNNHNKLFITLLQVSEYIIEQAKHREKSVLQDFEGIKNYLRFRFSELKYDLALKYFICSSSSSSIKCSRI